MGTLIVAGIEACVSTSTVVEEGVAVTVIVALAVLGLAVSEVGAKVTTTVEDVVATSMAVLSLLDVSVAPPSTVVVEVTDTVPVEFLRLTTPSGGSLKLVFMNS